MKKLIPLLFLSSMAFGGTRTLSFGPGGGTITISSGTAGAGGSPLTFVQAVSTATDDGGCGSTLTPITPTAGHLLVMGCYTPNNISGITVSDNVGDSWLTAGTTTQSANFTAIYYVKSAVGGATTVTAAVNACNGRSFCILAEYSGQDPSNTFDVFSGSTPVATSLSPITALSTTTTHANELMFAFGAESSGGAITSQTGTSRYEDQWLAGGTRWFAQDSNVPTAQVYASTWTAASYWNWSAVQAAFNHL